MKTRRTIGTGIVALAKSTTLLIGVPYAIFRLWFAFPHVAAGSRFGYLVSPSAIGRIVLIVVGELWCIAAFRLGRDVVGAIAARGRTEPTTWSARWASSIAGLILLGSTGALLSSGSAYAASATPATHRPVAARAVTALSRTTHHESTRGDRPEGERDAHVTRGHELTSLGMLTTAALARRIEVLRRLSQCQRRLGDNPLRPDARVSSTVSALATTKGGELLDRIESLNGLLWSVYRAPDQRPLPDLAFVRAAPEEIELVLSTPVRDAPSPFRAMNGGTSWVLDSSVPLRVSPSPSPSARLFPSLVPVGESGSSTYLLALGPSRVLGVTGARDEVASVSAGLLGALRTLPWAEELDIELIGRELPASEELCFQFNASNIGMLGDLAARSPRPIASRLRTTWQKEPLIYIDQPCADAIGDQMLSHLGSGSGVVVAGRHGTENIVLNAHRAILEPYGITLEPPRLSDSQRALVDSLLSGPVAHPFVPGQTSDRPGASRRSIRNVDASVKVAILRPMPLAMREGHVGAIDADVTVVSLLAYLATRGGAASGAELAFALGDRAYSDRLASIEALVERAQAVLGSRATIRASSDPPDRRTYQLARPILTDWDEFVAESARSEHTPSDRARHFLTHALTLVEGAPASDAHETFRWLGAEGHIAEITTGVIDTAHRLFTLEFAIGARTKARWACERGLLVEPCSEILVRDLLAIHAADRDLKSAGMLYAALETGLGELNGAEPSSETRALYESIME